MTLLPDDTQRVLTLHADGHGARAISKITGISYARVRYFLEKRGVSAQWSKTREPESVPPKTNDVCPQPISALVWDIECTDLRSDLGLLLCVSFLDLSTGKVEIMDVHETGGEKNLVLWVKEKVTSADILIGHNSDGFDKNFINGVLARHKQGPLPKRIHYDTYQIARNGFKGLCSYSLRNLADFFGLTEQKDTVSRHDWRDAPVNPESMARLREYCIQDVKVTAQLWQVMKTFLFSWRGR